MSIRAPFVCKWYDFDSHSEQRFFNTREKLEIHVYNDHRALDNLATFIRGKRIFPCPWEDCKKQLNDIIKLEVHLCKHIKQNPFKCPICSRRFSSPDKLQSHLISCHDDIVLDFTEEDNTSECEDFDPELHKKKMMKRKEDDGKTEDELMWELICEFFDPELVEAELAEFEAVEKRYKETVFP